MKIIIGSDKSGYNLKEAVKAHLVDRGCEVFDCGTQDLENGIPYFKVASAAAEKMQSGAFDKGILICGTGMGMSLVANKYQGVYAACVESTYAAEKCRAINDANVLTMGGWIIGAEMGYAIVDKFLDTAFTENLEPWRQTFLKNAKEEFGKIENSIYSK